MPVASTNVPDQPLLTTNVKPNGFNEVYVTLDGDPIISGSLIPGRQITASAGQNGTLVLTISTK